MPSRHRIDLQKLRISEQRILMATRLVLAWGHHRSHVMAEPDAAAPAKAKPAALRKGALVRVNKTAFKSSLEASASDPTAPDYIFEGPGELLVVKGDYGQVRWNRPVPDVWLRMDQLEACS